MATYFHVIADNRSEDDDRMPELIGSLDGKYISRDCAMDQIIDVSSVVDLENDRIIDIVLYSTSDADDDQYEERPSCEIDDQVMVGTNPPELEDNYWGNYFYRVKDTTNIRRNRALMQLFDCVTRFTTEQCVGYNTSVRIGSIGDAPLYLTEPLDYESTSTGLVTFYFNTNPKSGWFKCFLDNYEKLTSVLNPDYKPSMITTLGHPDVNGWRTVLNGQYEGFEFDFFPKNATPYNWWTQIEGLGHNIKVRYLNGAGVPLPHAAWYPVMNINTGTGAKSRIGARTSVYKVEARYIEPRDIYI